jgi:hypothetical protein
MTQAMLTYVHYSAAIVRIWQEECWVWENERPPWLGYCSDAEYATQCANAQEN